MIGKPRCTCAAGDGAYLAAHSEMCAVTKFARRASSSPVKATRKLAASILRDLVGDVRESSKDREGATFLSLDL